MSYYFLIILCFLFFIFAGIKNSRIVYVKKLTLPLAGILFILGLFLFSSTSVKAASKGIDLWLNVVFPSLFPFFVISELLQATGFVRAMGILLEPVMRPLFNIPGCGSFAFLMGITSGYPVGAKITAEMRKEELLTKTEAERLLAFSNNSGPLFIIGAVSVGMFQLPQLGLFLLTCHILACVTVGLLFRFYKKSEENRKIQLQHNIIHRFKQEARKIRTQNLGEMFGDSVRNSISTILAIGGFIIFFSVIINLLLEVGFIRVSSDLLGLLLGPLGLDRDIAATLICGFFEITTGVNTASKAIHAPFIQQLTAASMVIGWAGLSVHSQVISIVSKAEIRVAPYLLGKFLQGLFAGVYCFLSWMILGNTILNTKPTLSLQTFERQNSILDYLSYSCLAILYTLAFFLVTAVLATLLTRKKSRN